MSEALLLQDLQLVLHVGVAERRAQEEAVELRLGQRERAFVLDRVLGRDEQERRGQLARDSVDRDLLLGHGLEQRGLGLRRRAVDLVDEHDVGEHRPGPELEVSRPLVEDREPGHVRRLEVGSALDPRRRRPLDGSCDRAREHGLRRAGNVLEQDVPPTGERGQDELDLVALPVDDRLDVVDEALRDRARALEALRLAVWPRYRRFHRRDAIWGLNRHRMSGSTPAGGALLERS